MNILLLGSGGREHALAWKISQSPLCHRLFIAPGNPGTARCGENISLSTGNFAALAAFCLRETVSMLVVGPEDPLVNGIYDYFKADPALAAVQVVGPSAAGAQLEGSKAFAKAFMQRHGIPTAAYRAFTKESYQEGVAYLKNHALPIVLKADGLAAGKGVIIAQTHDEALHSFEEMLHTARFGAAGEKVVVEQFLTGIELSVFALTDGNEYVLLPEAKDYKRIGEGDTGPNTGGMGAVSPVPFADKVFMEKVISQVVAPTINGLAKEGLVYHGFVFFGLIKVGDEPYVIEYNCRMGDPETEVVMPRLQTDLVELMVAMGKGTLRSQEVRVDPRAAATVVLVSGGYPNDVEKGKRIHGLDSNFSPHVHVFYAGVMSKDEGLLTNGGRVAAVTSYGDGIQGAVANAVAAIGQIGFEKMTFRRDIGFEFIQ